MVERRRRDGYPRDGGRSVRLLPGALSHLKIGYTRTVQLKSISDVIRGPSFPEPRDQDFEQMSFKYADMTFAHMNSNGYVLRILKKMPIVGDRKHIVVDVKVHDLEEGVTPALKHWHLDCCGKLGDPGREEHHHLFVSGDKCLTEFLANRVEVEPGRDVYLEDQPAAPLPVGNTIYTYGRTYHRASPSTGRHRRLLIRVSETDLIRPKNQVLSVTYRR